MTQGWHNLSYVHWRYDPNVVQALLPNGFVVDTFGGGAWVGLIPFEMRGIAFPISSRLTVRTGRFGSFPETNVRTYIIDSLGRRGVWFFSLDINRVAPTAIARAGYGLPYCFADMGVESSINSDRHVVRYTSQRRWPTRGRNSHGVKRPSSVVAIKSGQQLAVDAESLDAFTSARWALGSRFLGVKLWAEVDHPTWDLYDAELLEFDETLLVAAGLPEPKGDPVVRWSPGVTVRIARPQIVRPGRST
jgi:uncharacterized protein